jgi:hypothetical protein
LILRTIVDLSKEAGQVAQSYAPLFTQAFFATLAAGLALGFLAEYLKYRKEDALARYQLEALRLRLRIASQRSNEFIRFLATWAKEDPDGFKMWTTKKPDPLAQFAGSLEQIYSDLGLKDFKLPDLPIPDLPIPAESRPTGPGL